MSTYVCVYKYIITPPNIYSHIHIDTHTALGVVCISIQHYTAIFILLSSAPRHLQYTCQTNFYF